MAPTAAGWVGGLDRARMKQVLAGELRLDACRDQYDMDVKAQAPVLAQVKQASA
jgi:hypothetical protein